MLSQRKHIKWYWDMYDLFNGILSARNMASTSINICQEYWTCFRSICEQTTAANEFWQSCAVVDPYPRPPSRDVPWFPRAGIKPSGSGQITHVIVKVTRANAWPLLTMAPRVRLGQTSRWSKPFTFRRWERHVLLPRQWIRLYSQHHRPINKACNS